MKNNELNKGNKKAKLSSNKDASKNVQKKIVAKKNENEVKKDTVTKGNKSPIAIKKETITTKKKRTNDSPIKKNVSTDKIKLNKINKNNIGKVKKKEENQETKINSNRKKIKFKRQFWILIILLSILVITFSAFRIFNWNKDNKTTNKQIKEMDDIAKELPVNLENEELVNPPDDKDSDYWRYISLPLISVDFKELLDKNSDTVAFIKVNGTNINYPVVQTDNNEYYLNHSFDKSKNSAGWVFLDYRNDINNLQDNTIIYAHGRIDTTMFGSLKNVFKNDWYNNTDNYTINISTPQENTLWRVFSVYQIPTEIYYLTSSFGSNESHQKFIDTVVSRSKYDFNTSVNTSDKILTLSTCYNKTDKVVLHAKLIKRQVR